MGLLDDFFRRGREGAARAKGQGAKPTVQPQQRQAQSEAPVRPEQTRPAAPQPTQRTHTVQPGDTLSALAKRFYGDANDYRRIFEANRDILDDPDLIHPGQTLKIP